MNSSSSRPKNLNISYQLPHSDISLPDLPLQKNHKRTPKAKHPKSQTPADLTPLSSHPTLATALPSQKKFLSPQKNPSEADGTLTPSVKQTTNPKKPKKSKSYRITKNHSAPSPGSLQLSLPEVPDFEPLKHEVPLH